MVEENNDIRFANELRRSKGEWMWKVYLLINDVTIPSGYLISYGRLAEIANNKYGMNIQARNVANLRRKLYGYKRSGQFILPKNLPLHRISVKGDVKSLRDSELARKENNFLRNEEGSLLNPKWI